ncbi:MAG: GNAT family N-acetyltransferase [Roseibium sp.]|nr:GNAT family N-acetyltransferase [Roseibium sp.]
MARFDLQTRGGLDIDAEMLVVRQLSAPSRADMKALWARLPGGPVSTPFQSPRYFESFQRHMVGPVNGELSIYSIEHRGLSLPLMLIPVLVRRRGPIRIASMPDLTLADQNAPVLARGIPLSGRVLKSCWTAFLGCLDRADVLDIFNIPPAVDGMANPLFELDACETYTEALTFDLTDEQAEARWRKKSVYKEARAKMRKLEGQGAEFFVATDPQDRVDVFSKLLADRRQRLRGLTRAACAETGPKDRFYADLAANTGPDNPAQVFGIRAGEELIAGAIGMMTGKTFNGVLISIGDPKWHKLSPGIVLISQIIEWAKAHGIETFCFGTGLQSYKQRFGAVSQPMRRLNVPLTFAGRAYIKMRKAKDVLKAGNVFLRVQKS